jgi:hypothetical protein
VSASTISTELAAKAATRTAAVEVAVPEVARRRVMAMS